MTNVLVVWECIVDNFYSIGCFFHCTKYPIFSFTAELISFIQLQILGLTQAGHKTVTSWLRSQHSIIILGGIPIKVTQVTNRIDNDNMLYQTLIFFHFLQMSETWQVLLKHIYINIVFSNEIVYILIKTILNTFSFAYKSIQIYKM